MNSESQVVPYLEPTHGFTLWTAIVLFFVLLRPSYFYAKSRFARIQNGALTPSVAPADRPLRSMPSLAARFAFARESVWLAVPYVVFVSFAIMTDPRAFLSGGPSAKGPTPPSPPASHRVTLRVDPGSDARVESHRDSNGTQTTNISVSPTSVVPTSDASPNDTPARAAPQRPAWVDQTRVTDGDCERIVLTSQQYATKDEAEHELQVAAVKLVEQDLQQIQTGSFRPRTWRPAADDVLAHAVQQRYDEIAERDFGKFTHPMIRVSWQVELSPRVRTEFAPAWRRALISFRILLVAAVATNFAMLASASLMYFRIAARTRGQSRGGLKLPAASAMLGWLMLVATSLSQGHFW